MVHFIVLLIEAPPGMFLYGLFVSFVCLEWSSRQPLNSKFVTANLSQTSTGSPLIMNYTNHSNSEISN